MQELPADRQRGLASRTATPRNEVIAKAWTWRAGYRPRFWIANIARRGRGDPAKRGWELRESAATPEAYSWAQAVIKAIAAGPILGGPQCARPSQPRTIRRPASIRKRNRALHARPAADERKSWPAMYKQFLRVGSQKFDRNPTPSAAEDPSWTVKIEGRAWSRNRSAGRCRRPAEKDAD